MVGFHYFNGTLRESLGFKLPFMIAENQLGENLLTSAYMKYENVFFCFFLYFTMDLESCRSLTDGLHYLSWGFNHKLCSNYILQRAIREPGLAI